MLIGGEELLAAIVSDDALPEYNRGCKPAPALSYTMSAVKLTVLATVALLGVHMIGASVFDILGDTTRIENLEDKDLKRTVANVVSTQKSNMEIIRITSGKIQVGHGKKYIIKFLGRVRPSNEWQFYYLSYVLRPWLSEYPQDVEFKPLTYGKSRNFK